MFKACKLQKRLNEPETTQVLYDVLDYLIYIFK